MKRRIAILLLAALAAVTTVAVVAVGPTAAKAEAKTRCTIATAGDTVAKVCGKQATAKAGDTRAQARRR